MADVNEMRQKFFAGKKQDIDQASREQEQLGQDALNRRFASIGQAGSGAAIGATLKNQGDIAKQRESAMRNLSGEELQSQIQEGEAQKQRDFQGGLQGRQEALQREQMGQQAGQFGKQHDLAMQQFELDKETTGFNRRMAEQEAGKEDKGLLGSGGMLGTGIGGKQGLLGSGLLGSRGVANISGGGLAGGAIGAGVGSAVLGPAGAIIGGGVGNLIGGGGK